MLRAVLPILFGAAFTVSIAIAMGWLLLRRLRIDFCRQEAALFAFVSGSACLSLVVFFLCLAHQASRSVFLAGGLGVIAWAVWDARGEPRRKPLPPAAPLAWLILFWVIFAAFSYVYFINALAPEVSPDGSGYHLGNVARYARHHGFVWSYHSMYSYLSQGAEMLFLVAFTFGGHSSAALVHFVFLVSLPLLMVCYGRRMATPIAAVFAALIAFTCPVAGLVGSFAYNDLVVATLLFAVFYLLQVNYAIINDNILILLGLLAGYGYAVKYTAFLALPFAAIFLWRQIRFRQVALLAGAAAVMIAPWVLRNWFWVGNPFAPFLNRWFPNPFFHAGSEQSYLADLGRYEGIQHVWEIPLQLTMHGRLISGTLGPVLLLAPIALLSLRTSHGRRLLAAALVFAIPGWFNTGARFLFGGVPFLSLAMGMAMANSGGVLPALAIFEALVCWPSILALYCDPVSWRIHTIPVRAAWRLTPESQFLAEHLSEYGLVGPLEREVPPNGKIFSFATRPEAYIDREIVVSYESAAGNLAQEILQTPLFYPPELRRTFRLAQQKATAIRIKQHGQDSSHWAVAEVRLQSGGREVTPAAGWTFTARPNAAEARLAFDGKAVTRWSTWEPMRPGRFLEADFGREVTIDEVALEGPLDRAQVTVEVLAGGRWFQAGPPSDSRVPETPGLRSAATRELKQRGIAYLLINQSDATGEEMRRDPRAWGITPLAEEHGTVLYRVD